jgi:anti-sigma B factor antagonist
VWVLTLHGEHDVSTQQTLREQLEHVHRAGGPVVVDLSHATFIDSTVIGALVRRRSEDDDPTTFVLVAPTHYQGTRLIELLGIGTTFPIYPTREAAIAAL